MRFTLEWLKEHLDFDSSLKNLCEQLTSIGLEVESVSDPRENYKDFVVSEGKYKIKNHTLYVHRSSQPLSLPR